MNKVVPRLLEIRFDLPSKFAGKFGIGERAQWEEAVCAVAVDAFLERPDVNAMGGFVGDGFRISWGSDVEACRKSLADMGETE
jgi:hypothetical protein